MKRVTAAAAPAALPMWGEKLAATNAVGHPTCLTVDLAEPPVHREGPGVRVARGRDQGRERSGPATGFRQIRAETRPMRAGLPRPETWGILPAGAVPC